MGANGATLLLYEEDRATRQLYARELGRYWRVLAAEVPAQCRELPAQQPVQAVVFALGTGSSEEWELLAETVRWAAAAKAPVIVLSVIDARSQGYALGVSAFLVKPVLPQQLIGEVARRLGSQAQANQRTRGNYVGTIPDSQSFPTHNP